MLTAVFWRKKLLPYIRKSNVIAARQVLLTFVPFVALWIGYAYFVEISNWWAIAFLIPVTLFILRMFVLMHDCGHGSLFRSRRANQVVGFVLGVFTGMPQYVWSKNHAFHHNTNGDWVKYGGVFNIMTTDQYACLPKSKQKLYWLFRQPAILLPAGFLYILFNPRFNWIVGNLAMFFKIVRPLMTLNFSKSVDVAKKWQTKYWKGKKDYLHMTYNNVALISIWIVMSLLIGTGDFFLLYITSVSLAGSIGILMFAVQHNFEDSYATDTVNVNHYKAALEGTSMLVLPNFLNWFTANIAYHHLHHLSTAIPNYRLAACHQEWEHLFTDIKRVHLSELLTTFNYQLWNPEKQKLVLTKQIS